METLSRYDGTIMHLLEIYKEKKLGHSLRNLDLCFPKSWRKRILEIFYVTEDIVFSKLVINSVFGWSSRESCPF